MKTTVKHFNIRIKGKVQGVWYRASAQRKARELGLAGYVSNMPDGSVFAEAEGPEYLLQSFVHWCGQGPELARVEHVEVQEGLVQGFVHFDVRR